MKTKSSVRILTVGVAIFYVTLVPTGVFSASTTLSGASPVWTTAASWSAGIPTAGDNAVITGTAAVTLSGTVLGGTTTIQDLQFNSTAAATMTNSTATALQLVLNGGRGPATPLISTLGNFAYAITTSAAGPFGVRLGASGSIDVAANVLTMNTVVSETGGARSISKTGAGRLILSGANTFTGGVTVTAGILEGASFGAFGTGPAVVNGGTLEVNIANANYTASSITVNTGARLAVRNITLTNAVTLAGGNLATRSGDVGTFSGPINVTADSFATLISYSTVANNQSINISGKLSGSSALSVVGGATANNGLKALILTNTGNDFSGVFNIAAGQRLNSAPATTGKTLGTASVNITGGFLGLKDNGTASSGTLAYGNNITVGAGGGTIELDRVNGANSGNTFALGNLSIGAVSLTVTAANGYKASFTGGTLTGDATISSDADITVSGAVSGGFGLTKSGTGALTLGGANTYTGTTTSAGPVILNGSLAGPLVMGAGQALSGTGIAAATTIGNGGSINPGNANIGTLTASALTFGAVATDTASVNFTTGSSINVTGTNGLVLNSDGTGANFVTLNFLTAQPIVGNYTIIDYDGTIGGFGFGAFKLGTLPNPRIVASLLNDTVGTKITLDVTGVDTPKWSGAQTSEWSTANIAGVKNWNLVTALTGTDYLAGDNVLFDDSATTATPNLTENVSPTSVIFNNTVARPYTVTGAFAIAGTGSLTKNNTGTVTISNTNSFTGPVNVNGGSVRVATLANGAANSPLGAGTTINLSGAGILEFTGPSGSTDRAINATTGGGTVILPTASTVTLAGAIGGTGVVTLDNAGTLTLSGAVNGHANVVGGGTTTVSGPVPGTLTVASSNATTVTGVVTGTINKSGSGTTTVTGIANVVSGITVSAGTLQVGDGVAPASAGSIGGPGTITNNASVVFNTPATSTVTVLNKISGTGTIAKIGAGTTTLAGAIANDYTGTTTVSGGSLVLSKTSGTDTIVGDLFVETGGIVAYGTTVGQTSAQVKDTASITINGGTFGSGAANTEAAPTAAVFDTVANVTLNSGKFLSGRGDAIPFSVTGVFTASGGRAFLNRGGSLAAGTAFLGAGSTFDMDGGSTGTLSQFIIGAGGLTINGGATVNLNTAVSAFTATSRGSSIVLGGDLTTTGAVSIVRLSVAQLAPVAQVDLNGGTRIFDVPVSLTLGTSAAPVSVVNSSLVAPGGLTKRGAGTLTLAGTNTYNGDTKIEAGSVVLTGTLSGSANIDVQAATTFDVSGVAGGYTLGAAQTLKGNGTIASAGVTTIAGKISPGASAGILTFALAGGTLDVSTVAPASLAFELNTPSTSDKVVLTAGALNIGTGVLEFGDFAFSNLGGLSETDYVLFDGGAPLVGTLGASTSGAIGAFLGELQISGDDLILHVVPEPGSVALLVFGSALLFRRRRNA
jgi:fibronectin-binding autotransporter adhesin